MVADVVSAVVTVVPLLCYWATDTAVHFGHSGQCGTTMVQSVVTLVQQRVQWFHWWYCVNVVPLWLLRWSVRATLVVLWCHCVHCGENVAHRNH